MKTKFLKRSFFTLIAVLMIGTSSFAQFDSSKFTGGNSFQFAIPMGDFSDHYDSGYCYCTLA